MSLLWLYSAQKHATADLPKKWTTVGPAVAGATLTIDPTGGRRGGAALKYASPGTTGAPGYPVGYTPNATPTASGVLCVAVKVNNLANVEGERWLVVYDGVQRHLIFRINPNGSISVYRDNTTNLLGTSSAVLVEDEWAHIGIEWTIHDSTGSVTIFNGTRDNPVLALTNVDTRSAGTGTWNSIMFYEWLEGLIDVWMCDLALMNAEGSVNNQYPGDRTVNAITVVDDGTHADSTPSTGTDRSAMVDDASIDDDSTYVTLAAADDSDTYETEAVTGTIEGIMLSVAAKKVGDGAAGLKSRWRQSATDNDSATELAIASQEYVYYDFPYDQNPQTTSAFVASEFGPGGSAEIGVVKST